MNSFVLTNLVKCSWLLATFIVYLSNFTSLTFGCWLFLASLIPTSGWGNHFHQHLSLLSCLINQWCARVPMFEFGIAFSLMFDTWGSEWVWTNVTTRWWICRKCGWILASLCHSWFFDFFWLFQPYSDSVSVHFWFIDQFICFHLYSLPNYLDLCSY